MKRTVVARDEPEAKRAKTDEGDEPDTVVELDEHQFECVVCFDLLVDPVVGKCGHDFCKACLGDWARKQRTHGRPTCPVCRKDIGLSRPLHHWGPPDELGALRCMLASPTFLIIILQQLTSNCCCSTLLLVSSDLAGR
eukprot:GHRQ01016532.1.p1 GENE.GHRQ01016532.1~~GHRQ01016532.1.p1  ORF type:complete len:138 (+),score=29.68 GHRQ01016532.1:185-598(+)